ncbi:MAG: hypothetical protein AAB365_02850, partial [Patescibacteria group bacterium]
SFIAFSSQGIHHTPFKFPTRKSKNRLLSRRNPTRGAAGLYTYLHHACRFDPNRQTASPYFLPKYAGHFYFT